jgi:hypothetical protein
LLKGFLLSSKVLDDGAFTLVIHEMNIHRFGLPEPPTPSSGLIERLE